MPKTVWTKEEATWLRARVSGYNSHPKHSLSRRVWVTETTQKLIVAFPSQKKVKFPEVLKVCPLRTSLCCLSLTPFTEGQALVP